VQSTHLSSFYGTPILALVHSIQFKIEPLARTQTEASIGVGPPSDDGSTIGHIFFLQCGHDEFWSSSILNRIEQ